MMSTMATFMLSIFFALLWLLFASRLAWGRRLRYSVVPSSSLRLVSGVFALRV